MKGKRRPRPVQRLGEQIERAEARKAERIKPNRGTAPPAEKIAWQPSARDLELYAAYCDGTWTMSELGKKYELSSKSSVWEIIHRVENFLAAKYVCEIREMKVRATERLEMLFARAMQSYKRSCEDAVTITKTTEPRADGSLFTTTREERVGQAGNASHLAQAREAIAEIMKIWGGHAPKQAEVKLQVNEAMRIGGRTREEALEARIAHLTQLREGMRQPNAN